MGNVWFNLLVRDSDLSLIDLIAGSGKSTLLYVVPCSHWLS
jgi:hypothetical protein